LFEFIKASTIITTNIYFNATSFVISVSPEILLLWHLSTESGKIIIKMPQKCSLLTHPIVPKHSFLLDVNELALHILKIILKFLSKIFPNFWAGRQIAAFSLWHPVHDSAKDI
jgi:hypothetical protein